MGTIHRKSLIACIVVALACAAGCGGAPEDETAASGAAAATRAALTGCWPGPNQVAVFVDWFYGSSCNYLNVGVYPDAGSTGLPNDSISSVRVGANVRTRLFQDWEFTGFAQTLWGDADYLGWYAVGNDTVSSMRVEPRGLDCQNPPPGAVALFEHANYAGDCVVRYAWESSCPTAPTGPGYFSAMRCTGLANDTVSSIKVGAGTWAYLCRDWQLGGYCAWENQNQPYLGSLAIGNDTLSSMRIWY